MAKHIQKLGLLNEDQEFVNKILGQYGLEIKWLADKLNLSYRIPAREIYEFQNREIEYNPPEINFNPKEIINNFHKERSFL